MLKTQSKVKSMDVHCNECGYSLTNILNSPSSKEKISQHTLHSCNANLKQRGARLEFAYFQLQQLYKVEQDRVKSLTEQNKKLKVEKKNYRSKAMFRSLKIKHMREQHQQLVFEEISKLEERHRHELEDLGRLLREQKTQFELMQKGYVAGNKADPFIEQNKAEILAPVTGNVQSQRDREIKTCLPDDTPPRIIRQPKITGMLKGFTFKSRRSIGKANKLAPPKKLKFQDKPLATSTTVNIQITDSGNHTSELEKKDEKPENLEKFITSTQHDQKPSSLKRFRNFTSLQRQHQPRTSTTYYKRKQIRRRRERQLINKNLQNSKFDETVALLKPKFKQTLKRARKSLDDSEISEADNYTRAVIDADSDIFTEDEENCLNETDSELEEGKIVLHCNTIQLTQTCI